jgi:hypothetical protein
MVNQFLWIEGDSHECKPCEISALFANSKNFSTGPAVLDPPSTSKSTPSIAVLFYFILFCKGWRLNQTLISLFNPLFFLRDVCIVKMFVNLSTVIFYIVIT